MSVFKYFKNIPRSPSHRATGPKCNFFSSNLQRSPWRKKKALSPPQRATGACRPPLGRQGPVARWGGDSPPFFSGTYFELFERVFVIIVGKISAVNSYLT